MLYFFVFRAVVMYGSFCSGRVFLIQVQYDFGHNISHSRFNTNLECDVL